jgi:outer membrane receptor protein involved in Fe transport
VSLSTVFAACSSAAFAQTVAANNSASAAVQSAGANQPVSGDSTSATASTSGQSATNANQSLSSGAIVITGTHIVRNGYSQPTPVTVVGSEQLHTSATPNVADYINTMPQFVGSSTPTNGYHSSSNGLSGLNALNLRQLGANRTLVLIDGQRSVPSTTTGLVDINTIPQDLIERVDVVTGGASAVYGSDAMSGVVNFILNKNFKGTKAEVAGGLTSYADDPHWKVSLTEGLGFAGDRGHFIVSGELVEDSGIQGVPRAWNNTGQAYMVNPAYVAGNGQPQYIRVSNSSLYTATPGGIIDSTALAHTAFGLGGAPYIFQLGPITANPYTAGGGDWATNQANTLEDLVPREIDKRIFTRASFEVAPHVNIFGQFSWDSSHVSGVNEPIFYLGNLTMKSDNAFIPASVASQLSALGITQFKYGTLNGDLPKWTNDTTRTTTRYVVGANGDFGMLGSNWTWNTYFQAGRSRNDIKALNIPIVSRYMAAIDAVRDPVTGAIVCRSTLTTPGNGCIPYDIFGTGVNNQAAINYVEPTTPSQILTLTQQVFSADLSGEPFRDWAGPVSLAFDFQHRREAVDATPDANSGKYFAANYGVIHGSYTVTEGSAETVIPIARDQVWAKSLDLNGAVRLTDYSTSGRVTTWKAGATWDILPGLRIRATRSRDIRAPNLSELFQTGAGGTATVFDDFRGRVPVIYRVVQAGSLALQPEKAKTTGIGVVLQPRFLQGFSTSVDYWDIKINGAIGSIGGQQAFDLCYNGVSTACALITPDPTKINAVPPLYDIVSAPINFASQKARGVDIEGSYHFNLRDIGSGLAGTVNLRYVGTRYIENTSDNLLTPPVNVVGSSIPKWRHNITAVYSNGKFTGTLTGRIFSSGLIDNSFVVCQSGCPASTLYNPTVSDARQPGAFYLDAAVNYRFGGPSGPQYEVYFNVQNLLNKDPAIVPVTYTGVVPYFSLQSNPSLYDVLGRRFEIGLRVKM